MERVDSRPFPPGDYDVVVVGSGPGGLQTAYFLQRFGVRHAVISADDGPGGTFRRWPVFERLISPSKLHAPFPRTSREYEWYDQNSLIADEPENRALVPEAMDGRVVWPARSEIETALAEFAARAGVAVRYGCRWQATRRELDGRLTLDTSDGAFRCRAAVFAIGVTEAWKPPIPGIADIPHYADVLDPGSYDGKRVAVIGKRNSAFELADGLLATARRVVLVSPRRVEREVLSLASVAARYFQPLEDEAHGRGTFVFDAVVERIERAEAGYRVETSTTGGHHVRLDVDAVIAATGFCTPMRDLAELGVATVERGRIPAQTPFFESTSAPGVFFAGNATQGAQGLRKHGVPARSSSIVGFRYNARVLAEHLAERLGARPRPRRPLPRERVAAFLAHELARGPELWAQKGYLARVVALADGGAWDDGILPLEHFVDATGGTAIAASVEMDAAGRTYPGIYVRQNGRIREIALEPDALNAFDGESYVAALERLVGES